MSKPTLPITSLAPQNLKRRRVLAATAAAVSIAGCSVSHPPAETLTPQQATLQRQTLAYQSDVQSALNRLDPIDRERIRAATQKPTTPASGSGAGAATPVILASAGHDEVPHAPAGAAPAHAPATPATPPAHSDHADPGPHAAPAAPTTPAAHAETPSAHAETPAADHHPAVAETPTAPVANPVLSTSPETSALTAPPGASGVVVAAPLSADSAVPVAVISPFTPPATPTASAMGSMTAMVPVAQVAAAEPAAPAVAAQPTLDDAMDILRKNLAEHPTLNTALALALLDSGKAGGGDLLKKLPESDQRLATDLLSALDAMKGKTTAPTLAERAAPILDAAKTWQEDADLALPRLVLASRVDSFGVFTPAQSTFQQGKRHTVIIYCEVANFRSVKGEDSWFTTKLTQQETLYTEDGLLIWRPNPEDVEDRSLNQRHDFYLVKKLTIPETLAAGKYTLRMSVTDRATKKVKIIEMPIDIVTK